MLRRAFLAALAVPPLSTLATAQQQPAPAATPGDASKLAKRIAKRYRIGPVAAGLVVETARETFPEDPTLLLALACVESSLRPFAVSGHVEIGLTQVRPELHGYSPVWLIDPRGSLEAGAHGLRSCIARVGGDVPRGLAFYNGRGEAAERYAEKVLREQRRLAASLRFITRAKAEHKYREHIMRRIVRAEVIRRP